MKNIFILVLFLVISIFSMAQENTYKHFSISARFDMWTPSDNYFKASNTHIYNNFGLASQSDSSEQFNGFGSTISPQIAFAYNFKESLGILLGVSYQHLLHEKAILSSGGDYFKNEATIYHIKFGFIGDTDDDKLASLYYGFGVDVIPYYQIYSYLHNNTEYYSTKNSAAGVFLDLGGKINFNKTFSIIVGLEYTYIPVEVELETEKYFTNLRIKSNFGGSGIHFGFCLNI